MSRRTQLYLLLALLAALAVVVRYTIGRSPELATVLFANEKIAPLEVKDPALRLDLLERIRKLEYTGPRRNISSAALPKPPQPPAPPPVVTPEAPPGPAPLQVPYRFFGFASDPQTGRRRAFFTDGEDVFILYEGETLQKRFRLLRIGNNTAEVEEIESGRRATLTLEQLPGGPG